MQDRLVYLLEAYLENRLTEGEAGELRNLLRSSPEPRRIFWEYVEQHVLVEDILGESRGRDLALAEAEAPPSGPPIASAANPLTPQATSWNLGVWVGALVGLAAVLLLAVRLWWPPVADPGHLPETVPLATVRPLAGEIQLIDPCGKAIPVSTTSSLSPGQVLQVGDEESRAEVLFADGTQVTLGSGTNVRFPLLKDTKEKRLHLDRGAVQVQMAAQEHWPLVVTTAHARITALGTRFRLYREPKASRLELEEGQVRLESQADGKVMEVGEGSFVLASEEPEPMIPQPLPVGHCQLRHTFLRAGDVACFSRDNLQLVTSHFSRGWKVWNTRDGSLAGSAPGSGQRSHGLAFASADTVLALGQGGAATFWKPGDPAPSKTSLREKDLRCGAISEDGRWLAQGMKAGPGEVAIWEADPDNGRFSLRQTLALKPSRLALSCAGPLVAVSRWAGEIHVLEALTGRELSQYKLKRTPTPLALSANGRFLAAYANTEGLILFNRSTGSRLTLWPGEGARVSHLGFSADGRMLFAGLEDGTARAWSVSDGKSLLVLDTGHRVVNRVAVTADVSLLATVGDNDCVKIWSCRLP